MRLSKKIALLLLLICGGAFLGIVATSGSVWAGGFYIKEQSVTSLGRAFAGGSAMGEDASTIFLNPAAMTLLQDAEITVGSYLVVPHSDLENRGSTSTSQTPAGRLTRPIIGSDSDDASDPMPLLNAYLAYPLIGRDFWFGLGVSVPFGSSIKYHPNWFGRYDSIESELLTLNIAPSIAYKVLDWVSIGGGIDIQYAEAKLTNAIFTGGPDIISRLEGDDWSVGYNVGILFEPIPTTRIGIHYRSQIDHTLKGDINLSGVTNVNSPGNADLNLPDIIAVGVAHELTPKLTLMAEYNWYGWSNFKEVRVKRSGAPDQVVVQNYDDTFSIAVGAQYKINNTWMVRSGIQYDETPTVNGFRSTRTPEGDRYWLSTGASYNILENFIVDVAYSRAFSDKVDINTTNQPTFAGSTNTRADSAGSADIIAVALRYKF